MRTRTSPSSAGFSLIEVLVALVVLSIGLLGIAKMQALGLSSTAVAGKRALAAVAADSMAGAMHVNRAFWTSPAAVATFTPVTSPLVASCQQAAGPPPACPPDKLAAYDLQWWAQSLAGLLPNAVGQSKVVCVAGTPQNCTITITWDEKTLAINDQGTPAAQAQGSGTNQPSYTLFVQP